MRRRFLASVLGVLFGFVLLPDTSHAQTISMGRLSGVISDDTGRPLNDVSVTAFAKEGGASRATSTAQDGAYGFTALLPGTYTVLIERLGYRPKTFEQVPIRAGRRVTLDARITAAAPPITSGEQLRFESDAGATRPALSQWLSSLPLARLPWELRDATEIAGLASVATPSLQIEGLPSWLSTLTVDGLPYTAARHPALGRYTQRDIALPINVIQSAELVTGDSDVEWSDFAGGALAMNSRRGASNVSLETFGSWSGSALYASKFVDENVASSSLWGGLLVSGPIIRDTAHFMIGLEARKLDMPLPRAWERDEAFDAVVVHVADSAFNVDLAQFTEPYAVQSQVVSGFGRFDWQVSSDNAVSVRAGAGTINPGSDDATVVISALPELVSDGNDMFLSASLVSMFAGKYAHEVRAGFLKSTRAYQDGRNGVESDVLPSTRVVAGGLRFGQDARLPARFERTEVNLDQAVQLDAAPHHLKVGLAAGAIWHNNTYITASGGEFAFGGPADFGRTSGTFVQSVVNGTPEAAFNLLNVGAFVQDVWDAAPGLQISVGVRFDVTTLPYKEIALNDEWLTATGLENNAVADRVNSLSPRFNLTWDLGGTRHWRVSASAGRFTGEPDAGLLTEAIVADGGLRVRRLVGDLGGWPAPSPSNLPEARPALTLLAPGFRAPQTDRATFGISRRFGSAAFHLAGAYRFTNYLPRRSDLNLFVDPSAHDQHGRPLFGSLMQIGELVAGNPNRRFSNFDMVSAISADGSSKYWGVTATIEQDFNQTLGFFASYTRSNTTDNWLIDGVGALPQAQLSPFPDEITDDWREGTSDFDLPDRVTAGLELRPRGALQPRLLAVYRYTSGYPFTPGFPEGVDANGDGADRNDPAFVTEDIPGASELIGSWDCLRSQVGQFAERNACRQKGSHSLNLRAGIALNTSARTSAEIFVEGINLIESTRAEPDRALYLIDPNRGLVVDEERGVITVPLIANPHFGMPLVRYGTGRLLRIGLQVNH